MLDPLTSLGIGIVALYSFIIPLVLYLAFVRHDRSRMAWFFLLIFGILRLASGILLILYSTILFNDKVRTSATIVLGVGVIPLLLSTVGLLRIIHAIKFPENERFRKSIVFLRLAIAAAIILLVLGSILREGPNDIGAQLVKAAYILIAVTLLAVLAFDTFLCMRWNKLGLSTRGFVFVITVAIPFLAVRTVYGLLGIFDSSSNTWNVLSGSIDAFIAMVLVPELKIVSLYLTLGFRIPRVSRSGCVVGNDVDDVSMTTK